MKQIRRADVVAHPAQAQRVGILRQDRFEVALLIGEQLLAGERALDLAEGTQRRLPVQRQRGALVGVGDRDLRLERAGR